MSKVKRKGKVKIKDHSYTFDINFSTGHTDYSGYGYHDNKNRKASRRNRKIEEKRARLYGE